VKILGGLRETPLSFFLPFKIGFNFQKFLNFDIDDIYNSKLKLNKNSAASRRLSSRNLTEVI